MDDYQKTNQFRGLDMAALIEGPLIAAYEAQRMLASATEDYIERVGFSEQEEDRPTADYKVKNVRSSSARTTLGESGVDAES